MLYSKSAVGAPQRLLELVIAAVVEQWSCNGRLSRLGGTGRLAFVR